MKTDITFDKNNQVVLRPRFQLEVDKKKDEVLEQFESFKNKEYKLVVKRVNNHVFIRFSKENQHFWTPQLDLEVNELNEGSCKIYGLFGPSPTIWLFFMFLHSAVAVAFLGFAIWAYTNWSLDTSYKVPLLLMLLMVVFWFILYAFGRAGRAKGKTEMKELHKFMNTILNN